jgi:3-dehydroquinate synthase
MLKHALISSKSHLNRLLAVSPEEVDDKTMTQFIYQSVKIKNRVVKRDPYERDLRKVLNFGHTIGHAFESLSFTSAKPLLHGEAVANGLICELYLSAKYYSQDTSIIEKVTDYIRKKYVRIDLSVEELDTVYQFLLHDKKNLQGRLNFTLLRGIGKPVTNQNVSREDVIEILREYISKNA